jgi:hypothetical protein
MAFFGKLYAFRSCMVGMDCMWWTHSKRHIFEVRSFFHMLSYGNRCFLFSMEEYMKGKTSKESVSLCGR